MKFLPVFYDISDKPCLVVGGGTIAARKAELLRRAGGRVRIVATEIGDRVAEMAAEIDIVERGFEDRDLDGMTCVIAATDDAALNAEISRLAKAGNIPVNVVDDPSLCSFIMPSMIDRNPVQIAVSTGGVSPVMARLLRARLESTIPGAYGELAKLAEEYRDTVKQGLPNVDM